MYRKRRAGKRRRNLQKMGDFLQKALKRKKIHIDIVDCKILTIWDSAVGPQIAAHTHPVKFKNNTLFVNVSNPAWLQQLGFMKQEIMDKVNLAWEKKEKITNIYFSIGDIRHSSTETVDSRIDFSRHSLKKREKRLIRENLSRIDDEELKTILEKVMTKEIIKRRLDE